MRGAQARCDAWLLFNEAPGGLVLARLEMAEHLDAGPPQKKASSQTSARSAIALFLYVYLLLPTSKTNCGALTESVCMARMVMMMMMKTIVLSAMALDLLQAQLDQ